MMHDAAQRATAAVGLVDGRTRAHAMVSVGRTGGVRRDEVWKCLHRLADLGQVQAVCSR